MSKSRLELLVEQLSTPEGVAAYHRRPPACHGWMVTDSARAEAVYAQSAPTFEERQDRASRLLWTWQAGRCAICGMISGRSVSDHDQRPPWCEASYVTAATSRKVQRVIVTAHSVSIGYCRPRASWALS